ncbi:DNA glycosylase AlkZ-like family protein [Microbacterium sp.]|uniref:DNA glycosylase AlkZ-like family protein n=1 Tax=Microbacterium sp. TaxID=51671 RepID=UPI002E3022FD|nr:crosslink repair DNA glycosylase YcaQ family protein [Microbacterium sp.]HEX5730236.1 crosslink repair DNA glycosylase YcaQ family protein [Microbacterium sp.]
MVHRLSRQDARRIAVRAQILTGRRSAGIVEAVDALAIVNIDPTAAVAPSADHILWSRIGRPYESADLTRAVEEDRAIFEWAGFYRPMADLPLYRPLMRAWPPWVRHREWLTANDRFRRDVLARLLADGPLRTGEIPDTSQVSWTSTGWTNNRNVSQMLDFLAMRGEVAVSARTGRERVWDVAERVYPSNADSLSAEDSAHRRAERRLGYLGIARPRAVDQPVEPLGVGEIGEEATVDDTDGVWRVEATLLEQSEPFEPRAALLSPFDRLVFDRARAQDLFGYEYIVEMYKPVAQRRWGYFALPILYGDRLIGKLDAAADRKAGLLRVAAIHEDEPFEPQVADAVHDEIRALAAWLGLEVTGIPGS